MQPELAIAQQDVMGIQNIQAQVIEAVNKERAEFDPAALELQPYMDAVSHSVGISDFLGRKLPDREWLIEPLIYEANSVCCSLRLESAKLGSPWHWL